MIHPALSAARIKKIQPGHIEEADDFLAREEPLEIRLKFLSGECFVEKKVAVTMRTPGNDAQLAAGFLFTEGIISGKKDIAEISQGNNSGFGLENPNAICVTLQEGVAFNLEKLQRNFYTSSSCGVCGKASIDALRMTSHFPLSDLHLQLTIELILALPSKLKEQQSTFAKTGGLHASALFDTQGNLVLIREDVGRHNALDKLIGEALSKNMLPLDQHILLLSGRSSFELVQKAAMAGIQLVAAVGAPSSLAVETAEEFGITLIGFLRDQRFNIYSSAERIITNDVQEHSTEPVNK